ncbi:ribbon-helix-helix protein, CopG family [Aeromicrobium fastidiosum]|uniref:Ribbon-helix-helix protein, CopG family n=1 Tax=Aeromicrobium fastidiosum TaxID=52699 RepID=A0A641AQ33_9ACTN|nr:ribbon-helix-helix protein, CopG family [Aeromicrobium fastidiosum]KAA1380216.1 ribbon-helix-helix protein, CopG family [Aeromicrobium fastidiosum]MBP2389766.1 putative transcriptional regulator [Aeromicrobium fastidiosum]
MTMTLRLSDEDDARLTKMAQAEGISKNEVAVRAIRERAERFASNDEVRRLTREAVQQYGPLLDRLAQ